MENFSILSVIIPVYNMESSLGSALYSLLLQKYKFLEVVIINDGSTDKSEEVALSFREKFDNFQYKFQENKGVSSARNEGMYICKGELMVFMDADDKISPEYFQNLLNDFSGEDVIISGITKYFDEKENILKPQKKGIISKEEFFKDFVSIQLKSGIYGFVSNKIIKAKLVKDNQLKFDEDYKLCEDLEFFTRYYALCNKIKLSDEVGNFYNFQEKNTEVDYVSLVKVFDSVEKVLQYQNFLNEDNKNLLGNYFSELKYAYFNEMQYITLKNVENGVRDLANHQFLKTENFNKNLIKLLVEKELFATLKNYLYLRKIYVDFKRKWM